MFKIRVQYSLDTQSTDPAHQVREACESMKDSCSAFTRSSVIVQVFRINLLVPAGLRMGASKIEQPVYPHSLRPR
jgi:hypothetical protein